MSFHTLALPSRDSVRGNGHDSSVLWEEGSPERAQVHTRALSYLAR